jgi:hypothetical protein
MIPDEETSSSYTSPPIPASLMFLSLLGVDFER